MCLHLKHPSALHLDLVVVLLRVEERHSFFIQGGVFPEAAMYEDVCFDAGIEAEK